MGESLKKLDLKVKKKKWKKDDLKVRRGQKAKEFGYGK
jgi:hypothetical protein